MSMSDNSPSKFTLLAFNIPNNCSPNEFKTWLQDDHSITGIKSILYCYDVQEVLGMFQELKEALNTKAYLEAYKDSFIKQQELRLVSANTHRTTTIEIGNRQQMYELDSNSEDIQPPPKTLYCCLKKKWPTLEEITTKVEDLETRLLPKANQNNIEAQYEATFCGKTFIIFDTHSEAKAALRKFHISNRKRFIFYLLSKIFRCNKFWKNDLYFQDKRIKMNKAAEPTDIFWENLAVTTKEKIKKQMLTSSLTALILI